jgi:hypothetical protein
MMEEVPGEEMLNGERLIMIDKLDEDSQEDLVYKICGGQSWDPNPKVIDKPVEELVPEQFHDFRSVFHKKESKYMLLRKSWDHMIEMKPGFVLKKSKCIPHPLWSRKKWIVLLQNNSGKAIHNLQNPLQPPQYSFSQRKI